MEKAETLIFTLVDKVANLELKLYYTVVEDNNTIVTYSEVINHSEQAVVIHRALSTMADVPARDYDVVTVVQAIFTQLFLWELMCQLSLITKWDA